LLLAGLTEPRKRQQKKPKVQQQAMPAGLGKRPRRETG
jgi:hypothetical protein